MQYFLAIFSCCMFFGYGYCAQLPIDNFLPILSPARFENDEVYSKILDKLLNKTVYDPRIRPNATSGYATKVITWVYLRDISSIDELAFQYVTDIDLSQSWIDPRLAFNKLTLVNKNDTFLTARGTAISNMWTPDVYFENEKKGDFHDMVQRNHQMRVYSNGTVMYKVRMQLTFSCYMRLHKYPMDTQRCKMRIGSYTYITKDVKFEWRSSDPITVNKESQLPKFTLRSWSHERCTISLGNSSTQEYTCLDGVLILKREFAFHLIQTYVPTILLVVASWMSFWIDPNAVPARVSIGVTTLLTMITMSTAVRLNLPPVSYVKAIDVWMFTCIFYIFSAMIEFAIMNVAQQRFKRGQTMLPDFCENCMKRLSRKKDDDQIEMISVHDNDGNVSTISLSSNGTVRKRTSKSGGRSSRKSVPQTADNVLPAKMNIDRMARFFFPTTFIIFLLVYWTYYQVAE